MIRSAEMDKKEIEIFTDGACSGNQFEKNSGGWGAILISGDKRKEIYGGEKDTTNNRMELTACIMGLRELKREDIRVRLYSDSAYIVNCINNRWYVKWERNGWKTSKKEPVENRDLWEQLLMYVKRMDIEFIKVKGHSGIELNERADELANMGMDSISP